MADIPPFTWTFRARVSRVVDGDTVDALIDQGLHARRLERLRILGVNCPELHGPSGEAGQRATQFTARWLDTHEHDLEWPFVLETRKADEFGRYLAAVRCGVDGSDLAADLLASGNAVPFVDRRRANQAVKPTR